MAPELPLLYDDDKLVTPALVEIKAGGSCNSNKQVRKSLVKH
jgi:hypothetical protein